MVLPPAAIAALKGKETASGLKNALTGDIYVRKWTSVKGKGKDRKIVEHEAHINLITLAVGAGATAVTGATALWMLQMRVRPVIQSDVAYGKWVWPSVDGGGGGDASYEMLLEKKGIAPTKEGMRTVPDEYIPGHWETGMLTGYECKTDGSSISISETGEAISRWTYTHKNHDRVAVYGDMWIEAYTTQKVERYTITAEWTDTGYKDRRRFLLEERAGFGLEGLLEKAVTIPTAIVMKSIYEFPWKAWDRFRRLLD